MPVHLFGLSAEMDKITEIARSHGVPVIEDAAQSIGARYHDKHVGSIGACGCFSFFPSKNLGGAGDGGMITTSDPELAERIAVLRDHGSRKKYHYDLLGMNSRLDSLQAAILLVKFKHLESLTKARRRNADRYRKLFKQAGLDTMIALPVEPAGLHHVYNQFVIRTPERDQLREHLRNLGIPTEIYYPSPLAPAAGFCRPGLRPRSISGVRASQPEVLALPIFPQITEEQQKLLVDGIAQFFAEATPAHVGAGIPTASGAKLPRVCGGSQTWRASFACPGEDVRGYVVRLLRVFEVADVHVPRRSDRGRPSPGGVVRAPHVEQEVSRGAGDRLGVVHYQRAVHVPVDVAGLPYNLEIVAIGLVIPENLGVLEIRRSLPVRTIDRIRLVAYLLHIDFGGGVRGIQKARRVRTREGFRHSGRELECAVGESLLGDDLRPAGDNLAAVLSLRKRQDKLRSHVTLLGSNVPTLPFTLPTGGAEPLSVPQL